MDNNYDPELWFIEDESVIKEDIINCKLADEKPNKINSNYNVYFKLFSHPLNNIFLFLVGMFSGFIAIPINLVTNSLAIQTVISVISVLLLLCIIISKCLINKNEINIAKNYIFDLTVTFVGTISLLLASNLLGWLAHDMYSDFLLILFNNRITDLVFFLIFLIALIIMFKQYNAKSNDVFLILSKVFMLFSVAGLTNAGSTFIYYLLQNVFYSSQMYMVSISIGVIGSIVFILMDISLCKRNERKLKNAE